MNIALDSYDFVLGDLDEVRVVGRQPLLERTRQRSCHFRREVSGLDEMLLEERNHARVSCGVGVSGRQQGSRGVEILEPNRRSQGYAAREHPSSIGRRPPT